MTLNRKKEAFQQWILENLDEFNVTKGEMNYLHTVDKYYCIKPEIKKFIFIDHKIGGYDYKNKRTIDIFIDNIIDLSNIRMVSLKTNNQTIGKITKDGAVGRALVGGMLFGGAGAIVGSSSATETQVQTNELTSIKLEIITNDVDNPYSTILLYDIKDLDKTDLEKMEHAINNLYWSLENSL